MSNYQHNSGGSQMPNYQHNSGGSQSSGSASGGRSSNHSHSSIQGSSLAYGLNSDGMPTMNPTSLHQQYQPAMQKWAPTEGYNKSLPALPSQQSQQPPTGLGNLQSSMNATNGAGSSSSPGLSHAWPATQIQGMGMSMGMGLGGSIEMDFTHRPEAYLASLPSEALQSLTHPMHNYPQPNLTGDGADEIFRYPSTLNPSDMSVLGAGAGAGEATQVLGVGMPVADGLNREQTTHGNLSGVPVGSGLTGSDGDNGGKRQRNEYGYSTFDSQQGHGQGLQTFTASQQTSASPQSQDFAAGSNQGSSNGILPPVKNACLSCRAKKARCDGQQPVCGQCRSRNRECIFVKSRRGGARKRKEKPLVMSSALEQFLKQLDSIAVTHQSVPDLDTLDLAGSATNQTVDPALEVRMWDPADVSGILDAYYDEIHAFQPVMPPVKHKEWVASRLMRESPFLIACRAILALCPHPKSPQPRSLASRALRRSHAAALAREAQDRVDELISEAGEDDETDVSIECVQALSLIGLYEFGQTANAQRNRMKLSQALQLAMEMGLHAVDKPSSTAASSVDSATNADSGLSIEGADILRDMQRRTWWVLYGAYLISGLIAGKRPILRPEDPRITTKYPASSYQDKSWKNWLTGINLTCQAMDVIMTADFNMPDPDAPPELYPYDSSDEDIKGIQDPGKKLEARRKKAIDKRMVSVDTRVLDLLKQAEQVSVIPIVPGGEEEVARNQQLASSMMLAVCHIQLHRRQAFPEVALFSRRMCGLPKAKIEGAGTPNTYTASMSPDHAGSTADNGSLAGSSRTRGRESEADNHGRYGHGSRSVSRGVETTRSTSAGLDSSPASQQQGWQSAATEVGEVPFAGLLWDPAIYPDAFPTPWFVQPNGAASLYQPLQEPPAYLPALEGVFTADNGYVGKPLDEFAGSTVSGSQATLIALDDKTPRSPPKPHKAWGVDVKPMLPSASKAKDGSVNGEDADDEDGAEDALVGSEGPFPPGISLQRCATAAHSIVRLEVLHRSAALALWKGSPKWLPFCACGLVSAAYAFLMLCLAVQASEGFSLEDEKAQEELNALWTNVKVLSAGLSSYGQMWDGIDLMAKEVKAALEAATRLPEEIRSSASPVSSSHYIGPN